MKKVFGIACIVLIQITAFAQQKPVSPEAKKFQQDRAAIKAMVGCYKVNFEFAETFSPDTSYKYHDRKFDWGIEYVLLTEDSEKKIGLQHLLIVNDTMIIKHWRQDWVYENKELLSFYKDNEWKKESINPESIKGTWTQKVYQVDDSPRYEGFGTWVHVDGKHYWESTADAPLPRREHTKRSDYNVMKRHSRIEITATGWVLEQNNEKILRGNGVDKLLCWERGMETFTKGSYNCQPAIDWWNKNTKYWADVRSVWSEVYAASSSLQLVKKVDNQFLFEQLFDKGEAFAAPAVYNSAEARKAIQAIITAYTKK